MPTLTLQAGQYIHFDYTLRHGIGRRDTIRFYVESERPIDTYVVDEHAFGDFAAGREFTSFGGAEKVTEHRGAVRVPYDGHWYLIISNGGNEPTAVHYEVFW